ncbi:Mannose-6-phosphate isomerase, cupin superfamily [Desulfonispora thiosulfatigenes DSM 11270]|uniref:Mannose-6-phosphate isomerase, cupin superfamily n=1 Tax=Desulfonispora thiosulfatigenes DSM 11270 TaxID=656914 RepID=A0A1W1UIK7_DESTI|nr:cupin domain-containing protein [Desulfonispora thiosulfatigenes]SMB80910.1 Mannose-6-phosphate isomerase, cupin superfamily [Desulfonispora thiosulfatigenes DSM 11270]
MHNNYPMYPNPYCPNKPMCNPNNNCGLYPMYPYPGWYNTPYQPVQPEQPLKLKDYGPDPFVINIDKATKQNEYFRLALWTGTHLQVTLMSIKVGESVGLEVHPELDQFIRIEEGQGLVKIGDNEDNLDYVRNVYDDYIIIIPAGKWHNLINTGSKPLKLYSIYAPPEHPCGTVHRTKEDAMEDHEY